MTTPEKSPPPLHCLADGTIVTARLELVPVTRDLALQIQAQPEQVAVLLDAQILPEWPGPEFLGILPSLSDLLALEPNFAPWVRVILRNEPRELIGTIGFIDFPEDPAMVEVGYSIAPSVRGQGFGTEAATTMIRWVMQQRGIGRVIAQCELKNVPSIRILERLGFRRLGQDGEMLEWELTRCQWDRLYQSGGD